MTRAIALAARLEAAASSGATAARGGPLLASSFEAASFFSLRRLAISSSSSSSPACCNADDDDDVPGLHHNCRHQNYHSSRPTRRFSSSTSSSSSETTTSNRKRQEHRHYDVVIAGGGAVGSVLARLLLDDNDRDDHFGSGGSNDRHSRSSRHRRPLRVALLERRPAPPSPPPEGHLANKSTQTSYPNPRAYALSPASLSYLGPSALRSLVRTNRCGAYDSMQIWEHDGPAQLHFAGEDLEGAVEDGRLADLDGYLIDDREKEGAANNGGDGKKKGRPWLGAVVEDAPLVSTLWDELVRDDRIDLLDNLEITSIDAPGPSAMGNAEPPPPVLISYSRTKSKNGDKEDGQQHSCEEEEEGELCNTLSANLLVAADGANSFVRRAVGNFPMMTRSYGRRAVTCTVELESSMARTAYQRFLPNGPIALLPVWNSGGGAGGGGGDDNDDDDASRSPQPIYANVVWSTTPSEAKYLLSLTHTEFVSTLNRHLRQGPNVNRSLLPEESNDGGGGFLPPSSIPLLSTIGKEMDSLLRTANAALTMGTWTESPSRNYFRMPPKSIDVVSPILGFDLAMSHVSTSSSGYASPRVALVGDAAHTMHPMAGQGLNLGMDDANSLASLIKEATDSGMDVGGTSLFLDRYNRERLLKGWGTVGGVHGLHEIFGCGRGVQGSLVDGTYDGAAGAGRGGNEGGGLQGLIAYSRSLGMNVVNGMPMVRRALAEMAAGASPKRVL